MARTVNHALLQQAKINKKDEFYTQLIDIERELSNYKKHFRNKVVFCNCDNVKHSNFFKYFVSNFHVLGLKKLICACYNSSNGGHGYYYEYSGSPKPQPELDKIIPFVGNGDFRSEESITLLKKSDIIVTNPPFSLFREYIAQLNQYKKKFLIISNVNAITFKEVYRLIQNDKVWLGINLGRGISGFIVPNDYELYGLETKINERGEKIISPNNCMWLTNLANSKRQSVLPLTKKYIGNEADYPHYDNYEGIHIDRTQNIPVDYSGAMGVPITFLHKYNPKQFEIIQFRKGSDGKDLKINGKTPFFRILIKKRTATWDSIGKVCP